jgi:hypothetical protein
MLGLEASTEEEDEMDMWLKAMGASNAACGATAGEEARDRIHLHRKVHRRLRGEVGLSAQMATRAMGKAAVADRSTESGRRR